MGGKRKNIEMQTRLKNYLGIFYQFLGRSRMEWVMKKKKNKWIIEKRQSFKGSTSELVIEYTP